MIGHTTLFMRERIHPALSIAQTPESFGGWCDSIHIPAPRLADPHPVKLRYLARTLSLVVERLLHTQEVTGSIPVASIYFFRPVQ